MRGSPLPGQKSPPRWGGSLASWPVPFADEYDARFLLAADAIVDSWIADLGPSHEGAAAAFRCWCDGATIEGVHEPRW